MRLAASRERAAMELPLWPPVLASRGAGSKSDGHVHHAMHLVAAIDGTLALRAPATGRAVRAAGVLTAPDVAHAIDATGVEVVIVFVDPESEVGAALRATMTAPVRHLTRAECDAIDLSRDPRELMGAAGPAWMAAMVTALGGERVQRRPLHPRVRRVLELVRTATDEDDLSLDELSRAVRLSPSRLMHVFTESIGIPLRPYLAWLRLQRAAGAISTGESLTQAAIAAGFADSAHMSRTFRRAFGMTPSDLRPMTAQPVRSSAAGRSRLR